MKILALYIQVSKQQINQQNFLWVVTQKITLFNTILERIQKAIKTSNERGSRFTHERVAFLYYYFQKIDIRRGE